MQFVDGMSNEGTGFLGNAVGPVTVIALVSILVMLVTQAANRCFGLITYLPENVMRWVGGQGMQLGEGQDNSAVQGGATRGASAMAGGAGKMAGGAPSATLNEAKQEAKSDAREAKAEAKQADALEASQS